MKQLTPAGFKTFQNILIELKKIKSIFSSEHTTFSLALIEAGKLSYYNRDKDQIISFISKLKRKINTWENTAFQPLHNVFERVLSTNNINEDLVKKLNDCLPSFLERVKTTAVSELLHTVLASDKLNPSLGELSPSLYLDFIIFTENKNKIEIRVNIRSKVILILNSLEKRHEREQDNIVFESLATLTNTFDIFKEPL